MIMKPATSILGALAIFMGAQAFGEDALGGILDRVYVPPSAGSDRLRLAPPAAKPAVHTVTEAEVLGRLEKELGQQFNVDGELRLSFGRPWQAFRVPSENWQISVPELPMGGLSKSMLVRVKISAADRVWSDQQLILQAQLWKPVLVATRRLERGQSLDATAAEVQTQDVLRERVALVSTATKLEDHEVLQSVAEGRLLTCKDIALAPLVRKGAVVEVVAGDGKMSISMKGMAMGTGGKGDAVTIRNMDTRKDFQARVVDRNSVRVTF